MLKVVWGSDKLKPSLSLDQCTRCHALMSFVLGPVVREEGEDAPVAKGRNAVLAQEASAETHAEAKAYFAVLRRQTEGAEAASGSMIEELADGIQQLSLKLRRDGLDKNARLAWSVQMW